MTLIFTSMMIVMGIFKSYMYDIISVLNQQVELKEEISQVFENLDEAIICKSKKGINFSNNAGWNYI